MTTVFSPLEIKQYLAYEKVRLKGKYSMADPKALKQTKLGDAAYASVVKNYYGLRKQHEASIIKPS